jgi:formiminotetrahydrofolate cyclodeaminase
MVCRLTLGKKQYADVQDRIGELLREADELRGELFELVKKDADSFDDVMAAMKLPKGTDAEKKTRAQAIESATIAATQVPLDVMRKSLRAIELTAEIARLGNVNSVSDAGVGAIMARTAVEGAYFNVRINLPGIEDKSLAEKMSSEAERILEEAEVIVKQARQTVVETIG